MKGGRTTDYLRHEASLNCDQYKKIYRKCQKLSKPLKQQQQTMAAQEGLAICN